MWSVYVLLCADGSLYTGCSNDLQRRFQDHLKGIGAAYTKSHPPLKIVYSESLPDRSSALKREAQIKSWPRHKKITLLKLKL